MKVFLLKFYTTNLKLYLKILINFIQLNLKKFSNFSKIYLIFLASNNNWIKNSTYEMPYESFNSTCLSEVGSGHVLFQKDE